MSSSEITKSGKGCGNNEREKKMLMTHKTEWFIKLIKIKLHDFFYIIIIIIKVLNLFKQIF